MTPTPSPSKAASVSQGDRRPQGWTEALAVSFIAEQGYNPEIGMFAKSFNEGAWSEIAVEWPEFIDFVKRRASPEAPSLSAAVPASGGVEVEDWRDDPASDERWNAGCDFAMTQLCTYLGIDPASVDWDAATETLDGDVQSVIGKILRAKLGEDWGPRDALSPASTSGSEAGGEAVRAVCYNGKRWRIIPDDGDWEMVPVGHITLGQAKALCQKIERALAKPASEPADGAVRERAVSLFENFVRSTACGHVVRGLISEERAAVWTREIVEDFRASLAALSALASSSPAGACEYCGDGKYTGLPGNACENCLNTGLKYPEARK